jgi:hypothetical protein
VSKATVPVLNDHPFSSKAVERGLLNAPDVGCMILASFRLGGETGAVPTR